MITSAGGPGLKASVGPSTGEGRVSVLEVGQPQFDGLAPDVVFQKPLAIERVHDWLSRAT